MPVRVMLPVLVNVKLCAGSSAQAIAGVGQFRVWLGLQLVGVSVALTMSAMPVPVRVTGDPTTVALPLMVRLPVTAPVAVGLNTTLIVQAAPFASVAAQVPPAVARANRVVNTSPVKVKVAPEVLVTVNVCEALVVPTGTLPKAKGPPVTATEGGWTYSTAPMSTDPLAFLLVPRISTPGARR
jgi:hypothetical protein